MKINEYKNEVGSLHLSEQFKEELKQKMLAAEESSKSGKPISVTSKGAEFAKKYSKYIALAACLVLVASTAGIMSLGGKFIKVQDAAIPQNEEAPEAPVALYGTSETDAISADSADGEDYEQIEETDAIEEVEEAVEDDEAPMEDSRGLGGQVALDEAPAEDDEDTAESEPTANSLYSAYASENYDGDYNGDDFLLEFEPQPRYSAETVEESIDLNSRLLVYPAPERPQDESYTGFAEQENETVEAASDVNYYSYIPSEHDDEYLEEVYSAAEAMKDSGAFDIGQVAITYNGADDVIPGCKVVEIRVNGGASEVQSAGDALMTMGFERSAFTIRPDSEENPMSSYETDEEIVKGRSSEYSGYYDLRDSTLSDLSEMALVRFDVLSQVKKSELDKTLPGCRIDPDGQTVYTVNITYEYLENESVDVVRYLVVDGTSDNQLEGRPPMEGEYIAMVVKDDNNMLMPVPELVYAVYDINNVGIAYHLHSALGDSVDPGDTNMGILPDEREVYTTSDNNPAIFVHKAAVGELTYYIRRNLSRLDDLRVIDFEEPQASGQDEPDEPDEPEEQEPAAEPRKTANANYPAGRLEITDDPPTVNGIAVGASLEDALKAFYLSDYTFAEDCTITLHSADEDGGKTVKVTFEGGAAAAIEITE